MQNKVSIIIPVYNVENYLEECLLSAINQDYENIEIIVVDDGSTDSSAKIVERFKSDYPQIKTIRTKNQGLSAARNEGLELATGDYVLFLDSDDWFVSNAVSACVDVIIKNNLDIVLFGAQPFVDAAPEQETGLDGFYGRPPQLNSQVFASSDYFIEALALNHYVVQACMYMYSRSKYSALRFYPGMLHEDNLFTTQLLLNDVNARLICLPDRLFQRRFRADSIMTQNKQQRHVDGYFTVIHELIKLLPLHQGNTKKATKYFITKLLDEILVILNPVYGWHIPIKARAKMLSSYFNSGLFPSYLKLFVKILVPGTFGLWTRLKGKYL
ncbi:MAG: glycosyltransferase [Methylotenera sp.]|uniref:glycosyltransferase family 2 protein n=1 Tax=Methylotenera sp. TaxID=2051956 RepID=UPI0024885C46|nr:glycosyltransferase family 2 protein [Methylotenera sp.]MDI1310118.1 glycosyltransferase [Methylotenera sp.]